MITLRLMRFGRRNQPHYRIVATEKSYAPQGKFIELLGHFNPANAKLVVDKVKLDKWIKNGAKPSDTLTNLLVKDGILPKNRHIKKSVKPKAKDTVGASDATAQVTGDVVAVEQPLETEAQVADTKDVDSAPTDSDAPAEEEKPSEETELTK